MPAYTHRRLTATARCRARTGPSSSATTASGGAPSLAASGRHLSRSFSFLDPGHLDGLENLLPAALRVVAEFRQRQHPLVEIDEVHRFGVLVRMLLGQGDRNFLRIGPLHVPALISSPL